MSKSSSSEEHHDDGALPGEDEHKSSHSSDIGKLDSDSISSASDSESDGATKVKQEGPDKELAEKIVNYLIDKRAGGGDDDKEIHSKESDKGDDDIISSSSQEFDDKDVFEDTEKPSHHEEADVVDDFVVLESSSEVVPPPPGYEHENKEEQAEEKEKKSSPSPSASDSEDSAEGEPESVKHEPTEPGHTELEQIDEKEIREDEDSSSDGEAKLTKHEHEEPEHVEPQHRDEEDKEEGDFVVAAEVEIETGEDENLVETKVIAKKENELPPVQGQAPDKSKKATIVSSIPASSSKTFTQVLEGSSPEVQRALVVSEEKRKQARESRDKLDAELREREKQVEREEEEVRQLQEENQARAKATEERKKQLEEEENRRQEEEEELRQARELEAHENKKALKEVETKEKEIVKQEKELLSRKQSQNETEDTGDQELALRQRELDERERLIREKEHQLQKIEAQQRTQLQREYELQQQVWGLSPYGSPYRFPYPSPYYSPGITQQPPYSPEDFYSYGDSSEGCIDEADFSPDPRIRKYKSYYSTGHLVEERKKAIDQIQDKPYKGTPIYLAAYNGEVEFLRNEIVEGGDVNEQDPDQGWTALHVACSKGFYDLVVEMVDNQGAKVNVQNIQGTTPLFHACQAGSKRIVQFLIEHGADPNLGREGGWKPIHITIAKAFPRLCRLLAESGANVRAVCEEAKSYDPLMFAISVSITPASLITYLISKGANLRHKNANGATALHLAVFWNRFDVVKLLVENGSPLDSRNKKGRTPIQIAARYGYRNIAEYLAEKQGVDCPSISQKQKAFVAASTPFNPPRPVNKTSAKEETASPRASPHGKSPRKVKSPRKAADREPPQTKSSIRISKSKAEETEAKPKRSSPKTSPPKPQFFDNKAKPKRNSGSFVDNALESMEKPKDTSKKGAPKAVERKGSASVEATPPSKSSNNKLSSLISQWETSTNKHIAKQKANKVKKTDDQDDPESD